MTTSEPQSATLAVRFVRRRGVEVTSFRFTCEGVTRPIRGIRSDPAEHFVGFSNFMCVLLRLAANRIAEREAEESGTGQWPAEDLATLFRRSVLAWRRRMFGAQEGNILVQKRGKLYLGKCFTDESKLEFWIDGIEITNSAEEMLKLAAEIAAERAVERAERRKRKRSGATSAPSKQESARTRERKTSTVVR